ncbi:MAG: cell division protein FtsZ, partial [Caulobacteraceae bacterium]|nr:cell division protein FtsZ [Caulobacteraceae bacterium]
GLQGVDFVVANTAAQALTMSKAERIIQLGAHVTEGLGAGSQPEVGRAAAEECFDEIVDPLSGIHMCFVTAGLGGGTGTGAAPIVARAAREKGILTVGVVTKPFHFEGQRRMTVANRGIEDLQKNVDTLIVIPNQNLFRIANEKTTFAEAFGMADQVLHSGVRSITDLMVLPGLINLDFADVRTVMTEMGKAMMGTGEGTGEDRALRAAENAIQNPLLDEITLKGAKAVLVNVTGGLDMTLLEVDEAANAISDQVDPEANIIFGAAFDPSLDGKVRVSVVATGMDGAAISAIEPKTHPTFTSARETLRQQSAAPVNAPPPLLIEDVAPVAAEAPTEPEPAYVEPEPAVAAYEVEQSVAEIAPAQQADLSFDIPELVAADSASEPEVRRIVDPMVDEEAPLFTDTHYADDRKQKGGFLSLFSGRQRPAQSAPAFHPAPQGRTVTPSRGGAQPAQQVVEEPDFDDAEDLEIPSFLRRLAN